MIINGVGGDKNLLWPQWRPEGPSNLAGCPHRGIEINILDVKTDAARDYRFVDRGAEPISLADVGQQFSGVPLKVEIGAHGRGLDLKLARIGNHLRRGRNSRRRFAQRVYHALLCKVVVGVELEDTAKFGQRFDLPARHQRGIAPLHVIEYQLLARGFSGGGEIDVARNQLGGSGKLLERFFQPFVLFELQPTLESRFGGLEILRGNVAALSSPDAARTEGERFAWGNISGKNRGRAHQHRRK